MKTTLFSITSILCIITFTLTSCKESTKEKEQDVTKAQENVVDAKADLAKTTADSINDFNKYKESIEKKLKENKTKIAELKAGNNSKDKATKASYEKQLQKLELKNNELESKIENYKQGPNQKWELFKVDFNKEVDELGKSISNEAQHNMKN